MVNSNIIINNYDWSVNLMELEIKKHDPLIKILIVKGNKELVSYKTSYRYLDVFYS